LYHRKKKKKKEKRSKKHVSKCYLDKAKKSDKDFTNCELTTTVETISSSKL
jgi:hypothetical protein